MFALFTTILFLFKGKIKSLVDYWLRRIKEFNRKEAIENLREAVDKITSLSRDEIAVNIAFGLEKRQFIAFTAMNCPGIIWSSP